MAAVRMIERWPATSPMVPRDPIEEDTLNNRYISKVDDGLNVDGRPLTGESQQTSRSIPGELVAYFSTF